MRGVTTGSDTVAQRLLAWTHWLAFGAVVTAVWIVTPVQDTASFDASHSAPAHSPSSNPATKEHPNHDNNTHVDEGKPRSAQSSR